MDDLIKLNQKIVLHWLGSLDSEQEEYLTYIPVCLGQFEHGSVELSDVLARPKQSHHNSLSVAKLNRQYLRFARLAAKDVAAGKPEMLIKLGITLDQAEVLANLTNDAVTRLAFGWEEGEIIRFESRAFIRGAAMRMQVARHHATALVATRPTM
jgi:hypothetical protein